MGKKENKRKSNLKLSLLLLLLAAILLISSSYAWFTSNQTVTVSSLNVNVEAKNGLQISTDATNWKSVISNADITGANATYPTNVNQVPATLEPVSTAGNVTEGKLDMFYGTVEADEGTGDYMLTAVKETDTAGTNGKYIAFDLFLRVDKDTPVYLTSSSGVTFTDADTKGMENAARMAFLVQGNKAVGTSATEIQALKGAVESKIWEPNYDVHTPAGIANANDTYGITTTATGGSLLTYDGIKAAITSDDNVNIKTANKTTHSTLFDTPTISYSTVKDFTDNQSLLTLTAGITKIRVYMWIEGQDVDCENNASGSNIKFDLQITSNNA
ncbi:MAG: hypothetical protein ACLUD1_08505 [Clostridia bacterium]